MSIHEPFKDKPRVRAIDLFCGAGGSSVGARVAGAEIVAGFDKWPLACKVFQDNFVDAEVYSDRIEDIDPLDLEDTIGSFELLLASPECTSHSLARGARAKSKNSERTAYEVIRFARAFNPRWIVVENVLSMKHWSGYKRFCRLLKEIGYHITELSLDASDFGVPQSRKRLYVVCDRMSDGLSLQSVTEAETRTAGEIVELNGRFDFTPLRLKRRAESTIEKAERAIAELGPDKPFLIVYYGTDKAGGWQPLTRPLRTITTVDRFAIVKPTDNGHQMRMLQVPELRRAMGFPETFRLDRGTRRERIHLLGNAVCPPVMECIVRSLIQQDVRQESNEL